MNFRRSIVFFTAAIVIAIAAIVSVDIWHRLRETLDRATESSRTLARAIERHASEKVSGIDQVLAALAETIADELDGAGAVSVHDALAARAAVAHGVIAFLALDSAGHVVHASHAVRPGEVDLSDRDYFRAHLRGQDDVLFMGAPETGWIGAAEGQPYVGLSRRISGPDGAFKGVIVAAVSPRYFEEFYESLNIGPRDVIRLFRRDGILLARAPTKNDLLGASFAELDPFLSELQTKASGVFIRPFATDGVERITAYESVNEYPLVAAVSRSVPDLTELWRHGAVVEIAVALLLSVILIVLVAWLIREVGRREGMQESLAESHERLRSMFETVPDGVIAIDEAGRINSFNRIAERLFGFEAAEVLGQNVSILMPSPYRERHDAYIDRYHRTGERRVIGIGRIVVGQRKDGSTFPMELTIGEAKVRGRRVFTGFVRDITERQTSEKRLQELQDELVHVARLSELGQMSSALAHELNQPLAAVRNYVEACRRMIASADMPQADGACRALEKALAQADRAGEIIRRLRQLVEKKAPRRGLEDMNKVVEEATALALVGTARAGIRVGFTFAPDLAPVLMDKIQIQQVIVNLVRNAVDAMASVQERNIRITTEQDSDATIVRVCDSGPGLAPEVCDRLFQPFVTTKEKGLGVGLSICRTIIQAHDGQLWAEPNPDRGVTFAFKLPLAPAGSS